MNGTMVPAVTNPIVVTAVLPSEKFRSRKSRSGTSGSVRTRDCHHTKTARPATLTTDSHAGILLIMTPAPSTAARGRSR